jgi:hypothetical protein
VHDCTQCAVISADGTRPGDAPPRTAAARTAGQRHADRSPRGQRVAADIAEGRREWKDGPPAGSAYGTARGMSEQLAARRTHRRQNDGQDGVDRGLQSSP